MLFISGLTQCINYATCKTARGGKSMASQGRFFPDEYDPPGPMDTLLAWIVFKWDFVFSTC